MGAGGGGGGLRVVGRVDFRGLWVSEFGISGFRELGFGG